MEIKVGEYVRTNDGSIYQLEDLEDPIFLSDKFYNKIVKHSLNIIDLIECGDYVNGKFVSNVDKVEGTTFIEWEDGDMYSTQIPNDKFIQDIVTQEQYNSMKYIVGE